MLVSHFPRNPLAQMEEEKRDHDAKMKKMETEMEQVFEMKVREKKQKLRDSESDVSVDLFCLPGLQSVMLWKLQEFYYFFSIIFDLCFVCPQLQRRHEQMRKSLEQQLRDLEEKRAAFDKEKISWEQQNGVTLQELRRRSLEANSKE